MANVCDHSRRLQVVTKVLVTVSFVPDDIPGISLITHAKNTLSTAAIRFSAAVSTEETTASRSQSTFLFAPKGTALKRRRRWASNRPPAKY